MISFDRREDVFSRTSNAVNLDGRYGERSIAMADRTYTLRRSEGGAQESRQSNFRAKNGGDIDGKNRARRVFPMAFICVFMHPGMTLVVSCAVKPTSKPAPERQNANIKDAW